MSFEIFLRNTKIFEGKNYIAFLLLLRLTYHATVRKIIFFKPYRTIKISGPKRSRSLIILPVPAPMSSTA